MALNRLLQVVIVSLACSSLALPELAAAGVFEESWYRMRSRENMKIGNYAAAIEAYEKYLELKPKDREALKGIALAYEKQGETDKAIARYDKYLEVYQDDAETAFKQANYLIWSRYAYRKKDAIKYFQMGLKVEDNPQERLKLARLLAQDKYDLEGSARQYEVLLQQDPDDPKIRKEYRGLLLWDDRFLSKAIEQYEFYVAKNPGDFTAREQLAQLLGKTRRRKNESVELYAQLVREKPSSNALRRDYSRLLAVTPGGYDEARNQYRILLKRKPDNALKVEAAQVLEQKKDSRPEALEIYTQILAREPGQEHIRMRRASIYMDDKSTAPKALDDYQYVLKQDPTNARAHQGAAEALAWLERPDDALYHAQLARKYSRHSTSSTRLYDKLSEGREPRLITLLELPFHDGDDDYELDGVRFGVGISGDINPYITLGALAGMERYDSKTDDTSGSWWQLRGEYRLNPQQKFNAAIEDHGLREEGDSETFAFSYTYSDKPPRWSYTLGYASHLVDDSYLALVGDSANKLGGATLHELYAYFSRGDESRMFTFRPSAGWVESAEQSQNEFINLSGFVRFAFSSKPDFKTFYGMDMTLMSYADDHSGFRPDERDPRSGGYFSPQKFVSTLVYGDLVKTIGDAGELTFKVGPKIQLVDDSSGSNDVTAGFFASLSYTYKQSESLYLTFRAEHDKVGDLYKRTLLQGQAVLLF